MDDLSSVWRKVDAPVDQLKQDDDAWVHATKKALGYMERLNLVEPEVKPTSDSDTTKEPAADAPKEPAANNSEESETNTPVQEQKQVAPKKKGRPRLHPEFVGPKRPRGRPRKCE